jgi:hypothetical protein
LSLNHSDTIHQLRIPIKNEAGISCFRQRLKFRGQHHYDPDTFDCPIADGCACKEQGYIDAHPSFNEPLFFKHLLFFKSYLTRNKYHHLSLVSADLRGDHDFFQVLITLTTGTITFDRI